VERSEIGIVTDPLAGITLRQLIELVTSCRNTIPVWFALHVAKRVCDALHCSHSSRDEAGTPTPIYHMRLGLGHVAITDSGRVILHGCGLAQSTARSRNSELNLDMHFASMGDTATDIASAAKLLYQLLTLVELDEALPASATLRKLMESSLAPASIYAPWVPRDVDSVLRRALAAKDRERFEDVAKFGDALEACLSKDHRNVGDDQLAAFVQVLRFSSAPPPPKPPSRPASSSPSRLTLLQPTALTAPKLPGAEELEWETDLAQENSPISGFHFATTKQGSARANANTAVPSTPRAELLEQDVKWVTDADFVEEEPTRPQSVPPEPPSNRTPTDTKTQPMTARTHGDTFGNTATSFFDLGLDCLRNGDLDGAELAWSRALLLDPNLRSATTNLNLLRKRRNSNRPPSQD
jgi:serine/threonine-protein kinase